MECQNSRIIKIRYCVFAGVVLYTSTSAVTEKVFALPFRFKSTIKSVLLAKIWEYWYKGRELSIRQHNAMWHAAINHCLLLPMIPREELLYCFFKTPITYYTLSAIEVYKKLSNYSSFSWGIIGKVTLDRQSNPILRYILILLHTRSRA